MNQTESLFNKLKQEMIEYCLNNDDASLEEEIQYHINEYMKYNTRRKSGYHRLSTEQTISKNCLCDSNHNKYSKDNTGMTRCTECGLPINDFYIKK